MSLYSERYSDISSKLEQTTGDVKIIYGEDALAQSIKNILGISIGERYKLPEFGSNMRELLFEPISDLTALSIEVMIRDVIERWEDRISIRNVTTTPIYEENVYEIGIEYIVKATGQTSNFIGRVRAAG